MFSNFINNIYSSIEKLPFDTLVYIVWGSYVAIFLAALAATLFSAKIKCASKRPFLCLTNAYAALTLAMYLMKCGLGQSVMAAVLFWVIGYILYGALCAFSGKKEARTPLPQPALTDMQAQTLRQHKEVPAIQAPAAKNTVRLEHAVSVTDKLLTKNLAKTDRQDLEKLKNTLAVLQIKGTLSPAESDILNENFNALLKLMAKYNV